MIPYAALSGTLQLHTKEIPFRVRDLSLAGFTFRLPEEVSDVLGITLQFYSGAKGVYEECRLSDWEILKEDEDSYSVYYRVYCEDTSYETAARRLMAEYERYIQLKQAGDDTALSHALCSYPLSLATAPSLEEQLSLWLTGLRPDAGMEDVLKLAGEFALKLDEPALWQQYLSEEFDAFWNAYLKRYHLEGHPLARKKVTHLLLGNAFCNHLFPDREDLLLICRKAKLQGLHLGAALAPVSEEMRKVVEERLSLLASIGEVEEIIVNDWGTAHYIKEIYKERFRMTAGILLQKRRKDVRMMWKKGVNESFLVENMWNDNEVCKELCDFFGITRISYETCGYVPRLAALPADLYLPFYQMNSSGHCTLYAKLHNGDRGRQEAVMHCPQYCLKKTFLYPDHLQMIGRWQSLFGLDKRALTDSAYLARFLSQGECRIVV